MDNDHYTYPPQFQEIKAWARCQKYVTVATLQAKFWYLTYGRSILVLQALQRELVIELHSDNLGRYAVYINKNSREQDESF